MEIDQDDYEKLVQLASRALHYDFKNARLGVYVPEVRLVEKHISAIQGKPIKFEF